MFLARSACTVSVAFLLAVLLAGCGGGGGDLTANIVESKLDNARGISGVVSDPSCTETTEEGEPQSFECTATYSGVSATLIVIESEDGGLIVSVAARGGGLADIFYVD
jgi:hypothetical protein